jgi:hypothetical protein
MRQNSQRLDMYGLKRRAKPWQTFKISLMKSDPVIIFKARFCEQSIYYFKYNN